MGWRVAGHRDVGGGCWPVMFLIFFYYPVSCLLLYGAVLVVLFHPAENAIIGRNYFYDLK